MLMYLKKVYIIHNYTMPLQSDCQVLNCYCPNIGRCEKFMYTLSLNPLVSNNTHIGDHNRNYFFTITSSNTALLTSQIDIHVLVDNSPPEAGVVLDGRQYGPDVDFTSSSALTSYWHGFIDHESGIKFYTVAIGPTCLSKNHLMIPHAVKDISNTSFLSATFDLDRDGIFIVSVIAYNNAMEPSNSACSDGVVRDSTPPMINNVIILGSRTLPAVICSRGTAWYISHDVTKYNISESCGYICPDNETVPMVDVIPQSIDIMYNLIGFGCNHTDMPTVYLPTDTVYVHWSSIDDEVDIRDTYIGIGHTITSQSSPDVIAYQLTSHKDRHRIHHTGIANGDQVYIFIKTTNKASLTTIAVFGPVVIDESHPICETPLVYNVTTNSVIISWTSGTFTDPDQVNGITQLEYKLGKYFNN